MTYSFSRRAGVTLLFPALTLILIFMAIPFYYLARYSLQDTNFVITKYVGLGNYREILNEANIRVLANTMIYTVIVAGITVFVPLAITCLCYDKPRKWRAFVRFLYYIPVISAGLIIGLAYSWMLKPQGMINGLAIMLGLPTQAWLNHRFTAMGVVSVIVSTGTIGGTLIIYMAAADGIPRDLLEMAKMDGANHVKTVWRIIIPMMKNTILFISTVSVIGSMGIWEVIYSMRPVMSAHNLMYDVYQTGFEFGHYGLAMAKTVVLVSIIIGISFIKRRIERRGE
jgi:ABC-type sugar transport system permease subunit